MHYLKDVSKYFFDDTWHSLILGKKNKRIALKGITLNMQEGDCLGVLGKNGSGKSTLLKLIGNILIHDEGEICFDQKDIETSYISGNERSFFWRLTVFENLEFFSKIYGLSSKTLKDEIEHILTKLGLSLYANTKFMSLSSGFKKRVSIARALIKKPDIFLFDEITSTLDMTTKSQIINTIRNLSETNQKKLIIWATHDISEALRVCNKIILLEDGKILFSINKNDKEFSEEYISKFL